MSRYSRRAVPGSTASSIFIRSTIGTAMLTTIAEPTTMAGSPHMPLKAARTASTAVSISSCDTVSAGRNRTLSGPQPSMITPQSHTVNHAVHQHKV